MTNPIAPAPFDRIPPHAGWTDGKRQDACRRCGAELPKVRRSFCSDACVHEWKVRTQPAYARREVEKRDIEVCSSCWLDCRAFARELRDIMRRVASVFWSPYLLSPRFVNDIIVDGRRSPEAELAARAGARAAATWMRREFKQMVREAGWSDRSTLARMWATCDSFLPPLWQADHIVPVAEGGADLGLENLRTLCTPCHVRATTALRARLRANKR